MERITPMMLTISGNNTISQSSRTKKNWNPQNQKKKWDQVSNPFLLKLIHLLRWSIYSPLSPLICIHLCLHIILFLMDLCHLLSQDLLNGVQQADTLSLPCLVICYERNPKTRSNRDCLRRIVRNLRIYK